MQRLAVAKQLQSGAGVYAGEQSDGLEGRIASVRGASSSADRTITIETDVVGRITRLYVADYAMDDGPDRLAATLVDQHRAAHTAAREQAVAMLESDAGDRRE